MVIFSRQSIYSCNIEIHKTFHHWTMHWISRNPYEKKQMQCMLTQMRAHYLDFNEERSNSITNSINHLIQCASFFPIHILPIPMLYCFFSFRQDLITPHPFLFELKREKNIPNRYMFKVYIFWLILVHALWLYHSNKFIEMRSFQFIFFRFFFFLFSQRTLFMQRI